MLLFVSVIDTVVVSVFVVVFVVVVVIVVGILCNAKHAFGLKGKLYASGSELWTFE